MRIANATAQAAGELWAAVEPSIKQSTHLEQAAQALAREMHTRFDESVVIARVFVTVPFGDLPAANQEFVRTLAGSAGAVGDLTPGTPVLSLIGTHGKEDAWTDRRNSKGHVGIPLISSAFVGAIPMISMLLQELGVPIDWIDKHDAEMIVRTMGSSAGLFFVDDAASAVDHENRNIIAAQAFVSAYNIKTVFGTGGAYPNGQIIVMVAFCRDAFARETAEQFLSVSNLFLSQTAPLAEPEKVFAS